MNQPLIDHSVSPVIQPLRCIPLALREGVSTELQRLLEGGIIEQVDASPWVSNLVVATKNGEKLIFALPVIKFVGFKLSAQGIFPLLMWMPFSPSPNRLHLPRWLPF